MHPQRRRWLVLVPLLGLINVAVGALVPPDGGSSGAVALARLVLALACSVALVFGPGLALRASLFGKSRSLALALVGLPGPALLAVTGGLCWWTARLVSPRVTASFVLVPVLLWLTFCAGRTLPRPSLGDYAGRALVVVMVVLAIAVAKGTWSPGPAGELYGGTVSRTLEVGARSDSRINFHVVQLVAHGTAPYSDLGRSYFHTWSFSDRGPLAGLAASPLVLLTGSTVPIAMPDQHWSPFDQEGFAVYRLTMSTFAVTSLLALFALAARLKGPRIGLHAMLLAALTPFVVHESYFTWPKLAAAGIVLAAAFLVLERRPGWSGLLVGTAYLVHPIALFSLPSLALLWLLLNPIQRWSRSSARSLVGLASMGFAVVSCLVVWRLLNGDEYHQAGLVQYALNADAQRATGLIDWLSARAASVLNTLVPFRLVLADGEHPAVNSISGPSPGIVRFYLQYWTALPFAVGLVAMPAFVYRLARAARHWPILFVATVVVPFVVFAAYWGADRTGLLREGLHVWVLTFVLFVALSATLTAPEAAAGSPAASRIEAAAWSLRAPEVLLMLVLPAIISGQGLYRRAFMVSDLAAVAVMVAGLGWLGRCTFVFLREPIEASQREGGKLASGQTEQISCGCGRGNAGRGWGCRSGPRSR